MIFWYRPPKLRAPLYSCLTVRPTSRTETKVCRSEPQGLYGKPCDQRIKGTEGITG